jgi:hypothetical protein
MGNFLKFSNNSQLSITDDTRLSRLEEAYPKSRSGAVTFSTSSLAVPATGSVTSSGTIAPTGITATGSTFAFTVEGNFAFTSDGTSIKIYWDGTNGSKLMKILRADGSNFSIAAGSKTIAGLTSNTQYGFAAFISVAQPNHLSFAKGNKGTPKFAFSPTATAEQKSTAKRTLRLTTNERITEGFITFTANPGASGLGTGTYAGQNQ